MPPLRYFIGCVLMAAISVFLEKSSHISSGGVSGLSIGIGDILHISTGFVNLIIKATIFCTVFIFSGKKTVIWTAIGAALTGTSMWLFEMLPIDADWPQWLAFCLILLFAKLPMGLLVSKGYSTGGYTAVAQVLLQRAHIPLWLSLLFLNMLSITAMYIAHGSISGALSLIAGIVAGIATELWAMLSSKILDSPKVHIRHHPA
ncbi:MAG: YitT family protein [Acidibacillus sp.]|uniref:YitT family protein n=1 Tax=Sulfoacidibacillus ferrooxidans TaxID=2005001 RepID=A0A9X1V6P9_9BACL|nr:YitT family protein [Sulfoacidibacillus ferrooxidans]MCI0182205.1 hypothetical protein [Sulfoacidibacillus ferrooxidans]MCY0893838.1 YitT family protein [Acidibacillus sp.]